MIAVALMAVLLAVTAGLLVLGTSVVARHRAQAAADLAALGAAGDLVDGAEAACGQAQSIAAAMRTAVADCTVDDLDVIVTVEAAVQLSNWSLGPARAKARAGPVEADWAADSV